MLSSVMQRLNDRRDGAADLGEDAGFTLIELMVVLLILAILLAIAIPTFLGVTGGANDRAAQSNINTALTTAKTAETQNGQTYAGITAASLHTSEPSINFLSGAIGTNGQGPVSVYVDANATSDNGGGIVLASYSSAGKCWYAVDNVGTITDTTNAWATGTGTPTTPGQQYGVATTTAANCSASTLPTGSGAPTWNAGSFPKG